MTPKTALYAILLVSTTLQSSDIGKKAYSKCIGCHGVNGEKEALGRKTAFNNQSQQELTMKLLGYKQGILNMYGMGNMKRSLFKNNSNDELKEIAKYLSTINK